MDKGDISMWFKRFKESSFCKGIVYLFKMILLINSMLLVMRAVDYYVIAVASSDWTGLGLTVLGLFVILVLLGKAVQITLNLVFPTVHNAYLSYIMSISDLKYN